MKICVYCGANQGTSAVYQDIAQSVGKEIAGRGWTLVYGGGSIGLMGIVARAALEAGGQVIGVIPSFLVTAEVALANCTELIETPSMHSRKQLMIDMSDIVVALPGGYGTLDELFEAITWKQLGLHKLPIGLLNVDGFYNALLEMVEHMVATGFIREPHRKLCIASNNFSSLIDALVSPD